MTPLKYLRSYIHCFIVMLIKLLICTILTTLSYIEQISKARQRIISFNVLSFLLTIQRICKIMSS